MVRLRLARAAQDDLRDIRRHSKAAFGADVATAYLLGLRDIFGLLRERPGVGAPEHDLGDAIRSFRYRSHRLYYRLLPDGIVIVRILHHARDHRHLLGGAE